MKNIFKTQLTNSKHKKSFNNAMQKQKVFTTKFHELLIRQWGQEDYNIYENEMNKITEEIEAGTYSGEDFVCTSTDGQIIHANKNANDKSISMALRLSHVSKVGEFLYLCRMMEPNEA